MKYTLENKLRDSEFLPHPSLIDYIDNEKFPFSTHDILGYEPGLLAYEEFARCAELFDKKILDKDTNLIVQWIKVKNKIQVIEKNHIDELKEIARIAIVEMFDIPEFIFFIPEISDEIELDTNFLDDQAKDINLSDEEKEEMQDEISKRIFFASIIHGSSCYIWKSAHYIIDREIKNIDSELMNLYDEYSALTSYCLWRFDPEMMTNSIEDGNQINQGCEQIDLENSQIEASGINLPVLLHELNKGVIDFLLARGIPTDYTKDQLKYLYQQSDRYEDEIWHYYIGPSLWNKLINALNVDTQKLAEKLSIISQMEYHQLTNLFKTIIDGDTELINFKLKKYGLA